MKTAMKLTDNQKKIQKHLLTIVEKHAAKNESWNFPPAYNHNWQKALANAVELGKVTVRPLNKKKGTVAVSLPKRSK